MKTEKVLKVSFLIWLVTWVTKLINLHSANIHKHYKFKSN